MDLFDTGGNPHDVPATDTPFTAANSALPTTIQAIHPPKLCRCLELICEHSNALAQHDTNWIDANGLAGQQIVSNQVISFNGVGNRLFHGYIPPHSSSMGDPQGPDWLEANALAAEQRVSNQVISFNGVGNQSFSGYLPLQNSTIGYQQEFSTAEIVTPFQNIHQAGILDQQNLRTSMPIIGATTNLPAALNLYEAAPGVPISGSYQVAENLSSLGPNSLAPNGHPVTYVQTIYPGASGTVIGQANLPLQTIPPGGNVTFNGKSIDPRDPNWEQFVWPMSCYSPHCPALELQDYRDYHTHLRDWHDREPMCPDCGHPLGTGKGSLLAFYEHIYEAHLRSGLGGNPTPRARSYQIQF